MHALLVVVLLLCVPAPGQLKVATAVVAGGPDAFLQVEHLRLQGTNREIGRHLAALAKARYGVAPVAGDTLRIRARRTYFARNYPVYLERMRGAADAAGLALEADTHDCGNLSYTPPAPGCSVVYYPPFRTVAKGGVLSRYYDFSTGTLRGRKPPAGELPATARPWLLELHPDAGHASLAMVSYDLFGVIDGINDAGLCVALLADDELMAMGMEPNPALTAGLGVLQVGRMLLDTCATVDDAKTALLAHKHYFEFIPCHYIVCDAGGRSFVWEHSRGRNQEHVIDGEGKVQVTTNFMLHRYLDKPVPAQFGRYLALQQRLAELDGPLDLDAIRQLHGCVAATGGTPGGERAVGRTLWHALYLPAERAVELDVYLGDRPDDRRGDRPGDGAVEVRRSEPRRFALR